MSSPNRVFSLFRLPAPPLSRAMDSLWWTPRPGMGSLLNFVFFPDPYHLCFSLTLKLLYLAVLELGAPLSSFLEEALYKCSIWMNDCQRCLVGCVTNWKRRRVSLWLTGSALDHHLRLSLERQWVVAEHLWVVSLMRRYINLQSEWMIDCGSWIFSVMVIVLGA